MNGLLFLTLAISGATVEFDALSATDRAIELLREHYVDPERLDEVFLVLRRNREGYRRLSRDAFVEAITKDLRLAGRDNHLYVQGVPKPKKTRSDAHWQRKESRREREENFGFQRVELLDDRIGYVRIVGFMEPSRSLATANAAMAFLSTAKAIIFDLRDNGGGYGGLPEYLASYFFEVEPTLLSTTYFDPKRESSFQTYSVPTVVGTRRVGIPVAILVNRNTASAAEWLAYTMQAFGKAIVVGEKSAGGAHMNTFFDLGQGLRISISTGIPINPRTETNWEQVGIKPNISCPSEKALDCALKALR